MKYTSRQHFTDRVDAEHERFLELAEAIGRDHFETPGVSGDNWTIKDLFAHLTEWERMFLRWHREGLQGKSPALPAPGYRWNETPELNRAIQRHYADTPWESVAESFDASYDDIDALLRTLSAADLFEPARFAWTGKHRLITYLGANTASHYATAANILKRWRSRNA